MFALDFFADDHFGNDYWFHGAVVPPVVPSGGGGHSEIVYRRTQHKPHPVTIDAGKKRRLAYEWIGQGGGIVVGGSGTALFTPWPAVQAPAPEAVAQSFLGAADQAAGADVAQHAERASGAEATAAVSGLKSRAFLEDEDLLILLLNDEG